MLWLRVSCPRGVGLDIKPRAVCFPDSLSWQAGGQCTAETPSVLGIFLIFEGLGHDDFQDSDIIRLQKASSLLPEKIRKVPRLSFFVVSLLSQHM
jgi:hypothetical protein